MKHLRVIQGERLYRGSFPRGTPLKQGDVERSSANIHIMPATPLQGKAQQRAKGGRCSHDRVSREHHPARRIRMADIPRPNRHRSWGLRHYSGGNCRNRRPLRKTICALLANHVFLRHREARIQGTTDRCIAASSKGHVPQALEVSDGTSFLAFWRP